MLDQLDRARATAPAADRRRRLPWPAGSVLPADDEARWLLLFLLARGCALAIAVGLALWRGFNLLDLVGLTYGVVSTVLMGSRPAYRRHPAAWIVDVVALLVCVALSKDWRSSFYLLWLTALVLPATRIWGPAVIWSGVLASLAFVGVAVMGGPSPGRLGPVSSETLVVHVTLPFFTVAFTAYAAEAMRRLRGERRARELLAIQAERRRIAWELHDSAKQRVHAAHLIISSLERRVPPDLALTVHQAMAELESTAADMDTSLAELRSPLEGRPLHQALAERVAELDGSSDARITVTGRAPDLPPLVAAHAYRVASEALTNALRHAFAQRIDIQLATEGDELVVAVEDDGLGMPATRRPGASGLLSMESRAGTVGGTLEITPGADGSGTRVALTIPVAAAVGGA
ncbi:MAG TPA: ATP-binding protein [Baekduia sp.]|nr:ATP-binding protein [Baekduia sp.]